VTVVRELITRLGFDLNEGPLKQYERGMDRVKANAKSISSSVRSITKAFAVAGAAGGALFFLTKRVADLGDTIGETSQKIGINAEFLQKLQFIGKQSGIEQGALNSGLKLFSKTIQKAATDGKDAAKVFKSIGINVKDASGKVKPTEVLFGEVANKFAAMENGSAKTALALKLFGRAGAELIPTLNQGGPRIAKIGDALKALGLILSDDVIKQSDKFNDDFQLAQGVVGGFANLLGAELMPAFHEVIKSFLDWGAAGLKTGKIQKQLTSTAKALKPIIVKIALAFRSFVERLPELIDKLGGVEGIFEKIILAFKLFVGFHLANIVGNLAFAFYNLGRALAFVGPLLIPIIAIGSAIGVWGKIISLAIDYQRALNGDAAASQRLMEFDKQRLEVFNSIGKMLGVKNLGFKRDVFASEFFDAAKESFQDLSDFIVLILDGVVDAVDAAGAAISKLGTVISGAFNSMKSTAKAAVNSIIADFTRLASALPDLLSALPGIGLLFQAGKLLSGPGLGTTTGAGAAGAGAGAGIGGGGGGGASLLNRGPGSVAPTSSTVNSNNSYQVASTITVNATTNADPKAIAAEANKAVKTAWNEALRQTSRAVQSGVV